MSAELSREEKRALRKAEKRKAKFGDEPEIEGKTSEAIKTPKSSKSVTNEDENIDSVSASISNVEISKPPKSKKRKHADEKSSNDTAVPTAEPEPVEPPSKKKKSRTSDVVDAAPPQIDASDDAKAQRKLEKKAKKEAKLKQAEAEAEPSDSVPAPVKEKKKKRKDGGAVVSPSSFPNPADDTELPDASLKSLVYAYQFAQSQSNPTTPDDAEAWKFSKARQNWLVRHLWYDDAIPERYVDLAVCYLKSVKGGGRDEMVKGCKIILNPLPKTVASDSTTVPSAASGDNATEQPQGRKVKFAAEDEVAPAESTPVITNPSEERRAELRKTRAQLLLDALES